MSKTGAVLTGGGARGAYQAGVLRAFAEIAAKVSGGKNPFPVISGTSAGAINAAYLASHASDMVKATRNLCCMWETVTTDRVFKSDAFSLGKISLRWILELSSGGFFTNKKSRALLDTQPLKDYINQEVYFDKIHKNIDEKHLHGLAITAFNYSTGFSRTFFKDTRVSIHGSACAEKGSVWTF